MLQLFRIECSLRTLVDDKPLLHHLNRSCHHTLSPIVYCNRPPVCQRSLLFGLSCLPASGLHWKGLNIHNSLPITIWLIVLYGNAIYNYIHTILFLLAVLPVQTKATSCVWVQSLNPVLAGQSMSLVSVPKQRSSSSHVRVYDEGWEKL